MLAIKNYARIAAYALTLILLGTGAKAQTFRPTADGGTAIPLGKSSNISSERNAQLKQYFQYIEQADSAVELNQWQAAEEAYRRAMDYMPDNPNNLLLLSNIGMMQHYAGDDAKALVTLSDAHFIGPKSTTILNNRATVYRSLRKYPEAISDYDKILEIDPENSVALFNRGYLRTFTGDIEGAESDLLSYQKQTGDTLNTASALAVLYSNTDRPAEALPYYTVLIKDHPTSSAYAARAMCHLLLDQLSEAAEDISAGMVLDPEDGELYYCRAYLNLLRYDRAAAEADAKQAATLGIEPDRIEVLLAN